MDIFEIQNIVEKDGIVFLTYGGFLSQALITAMTEALEKEVEYSELNMGVANNIFTIFIELSQNMMNYSKAKHEDENVDKAEGLIVVGRTKNNSYYIHSQNLICKSDMEVIKERLDEIHSMDRDEIKKSYRELRRSGKNTHGKGGGIGFYEIAKRCDEFSYEFKQVNESRYYFQFKTLINTK